MDLKYTTMARKNTRCNNEKKHGKNLRMSNETYVLRRQVMDFIYESKNFLKSNGIDMPRIDIRITDNGEGRHLGLARLNDNIVWMPLQTLTKKRYKRYIREIVYHEIVHAVTGFSHDENCQLMSPSISKAPLTKAKTQQIFLSYFK